MNPDDLMILMEKLRISVEQDLFASPEHGPLSVTVSVGGAIFPIHGTTTETLFERADKALYAAKNSGRNKSKIAEYTG